MDFHVALHQEGTSKPQTPSTKTQAPTSGTRDLDNNEVTSSNDKDGFENLITERQKGKRKASALAVEPSEPPPKKIKKK